VLLATPLSLSLAVGVDDIFSDSFEVNNILEAEPRTLVNDAPAGAPFVIVTEPPQAFTAIPFTVVRDTALNGLGLTTRSESPGSLLLLQNGVINNELVTNAAGVAMGEFVPGAAGQGWIEVTFGGFGGPIDFNVATSAYDCCRLEVDGAAVDPGNGEVEVSVTDVEHKQRSWFRIKRTFRSQGTHRRWISNGDTGVDWSFSYISDYLAKDGDNIIVHRGGNRTDLYTASSDPDRWDAPIEFYQELRRTPGGNIELRDADGSLLVYAGLDDPDIPGRLIRQEDRRGNFMSFLYQQLPGATKWVLTTAVDSMGRNIEFRYFAINDPNEGRRGRIWEIEDFATRTWQYDYDTEGNLIQARTPLVTSTSTGNDYPVGRMTRYRYLTETDIGAGVQGYDRLRLLHNLISIEYPNEAASELDPANPQTLGTAPGTYREEFVYGIDPADPDSFDRVMSHQIGGTNAHGVPAGGNAQYAFEILNPNAGGVNEPYMKLTHTDANGNTAEYISGAGGTRLSETEFTRGLRAGEPAEFKTVREFNADKETQKATLPDGNTVEYLFDNQNPSRFAQGNLLATIQRPGPRGAQQDQLTEISAFEPVFQSVARSTDPRGTPDTPTPGQDACGRDTNQRYTQQQFFDYQEGPPAQVLPLLAAELSISEAETQSLLNSAGIALGDHPKYDASDDGCRQTGRQQFVRRPR